jgi:two-component system, NarL family, sensor histidine kinase UhpB
MLSTGAPDQRWSSSTRATLAPSRSRLPILPAAGARRLFVSLVLAATIPVLLFGTSVTYIAADQARAGARRAASDALARVAQRVSAELGKEIAVAATLAALPSLDQPDLERFRTEAQRIIQGRPLMETISLADLSGTQQFSTLHPLGEALGPIDDRESFEEALRTERPAIGKVGSFGPVSGKPLISIAVPVIRDGRLRFVLTVGLPPSGIQEILREAGAPKGWVGVIVDALGNVVARSDGRDRDVGRPASGALRRAIAVAPAGFYGGRRVEHLEVETVYQMLPGTGGWSVHFAVPRAALNGPVSRSLGILAAGCLASAAIAGGLAHLIARDLAQRRRDENERAMLALAASEERGDVAVEAAELGTWRWNVHQDEVLGSERTRAMLELPHSGTPEAEFRWSSGLFLAAIHANDRAGLEEAIHRCVDDEIPVDLEFRALLRTGKTRWVRAIGRVHRVVWATGKVGQSKMIHGVVADIEPRKRTEAERLDLLRRIAEAQEKEQRRIARELHDQVGQTVTGLSLGLKGLERRLATGEVGKAASQDVQWLQTLANEIGRDIHRAASDLRPAALDDLGLPKALAALASDWSARYDIAVDIHASGLDDRLTSEVETLVYRVVQEAITNVLKHAAAQNVSIVLERRGDRLRVVIEDDGRGFDPQVDETPITNQEHEGGRPRLGLSSIRERLALLGGSMRLESQPGAGTALFIQVPLANRGLSP